MYKYVYILDQIRMLQLQVVSNTAINTRHDDTGS